MCMRVPTYCYYIAKYNLPIYSVIAYTNIFEFVSKIKKLYSLFGESAISHIKITMVDRHLPQLIYYIL